MDAGGPVDDIGLIDMDCEGDSLLEMVDCQPDPTRSYAFSPAGVSSDKHGLRLKEKFLNPLPGDNNVYKSKCLSPNGDDKENLPLVVDDSIGSLLVSDDPQQEKKRKKAKGFNLRKSLAWHRAFFTEEGVLDTSELSVFNGSFSQSTNAKLPTVIEVDDTSLSSDGLGSSDLQVQTIKEEISNESHKKKPQLQDRKPTASSSINSASLKMKNALASNKMSTTTTRRVGQVGACLQPPHSNSQRSQILGKTVHSMSDAQKQKAAKAGLTMGSINAVLDGKHSKSMDKDTVQKQFSAKGRAGTNIQRFQPPPGLSTKQPGKSSTRNFSMKAADSEGKSKKPQSRQELDICKASSRVKSVYNHIDENAGQLSSASSSSVDPSTGNNIHNRQRGGTFSRHLSGSSHTAGTRKDTLDTENTKKDPGLQDRKSELSAVSCHSKLVLPVYQNTKCTAENILPSHLPKPSALKMPSPTLGFFGQAKAFGAHMQTHKNALEACSSAHGSSSVKASCLPQVGNLINGCLPPSSKVSRPTSAIVGAVTSQIRPHASYKNSTGADLPSAVCPEPKPTLGARLPGKLKIEAPFDPEKCRNECDVQILMEANLEAGNVLIDEKHGNDKCVDESMLNGIHRHNNQKVVDIDQSVKPVGTQSPNKEKHHDDENSYKYLLVGSNSKGMQNDKPLHFVNTGIDRKHESMTFPCSRLSEMPSIGHEVQIESMPVEICDTQCGCETAVGKPLTNHQSMVSGLSIPDTGAESFSPRKPTEICNPVIDKKRQDTEATPFNGSIALDAGHASERKRLRSSGSTFDGGLEATSNEVVDMVTDPSDFQEYANSLFTTTTGEGTTNDDQEEMSGFLSTEDKSNLQGIDVGIIQENGSHSCRQSTKDLLVSLSFESPTSEEKNVARSGNLDSMMNDKVEQTARASDNSVDNNTVHYKCKINSQGGPLLGCSSASLSQDIEVATSHTVCPMDEEFTNIDSHGSINEWINSEKDVHAQEEEMDDSQLTHLMMDRPSGMTDATPFNGSRALDAGHASERKRLRSSGSTFDGGLEATSNEVVDMVTDPSDFQEYANSLFTTTTGEGTTNDDQEEMSGFLSTEDKSNLQGIDVGIIQENGSHSCRQSTKDLLVSLSFESPTSEDKNVARSGSLDSMMNDKVEQTARASDNSVDNNTVHYKCKINSQGGPLLGCSSASLSQDIEVATSHTVCPMDEEFTNIDSHGSINEWINSEKDVHAQEEEMDDSQLTHLMMDRPSGMTGELASCVEITQAVERAGYSDYGAKNTSEKALEFPTSKRDSKVVGEAAQGDLENGTSSAQGPIVSNNWMPSDCERQEPLSMRYPVDVEPFSDEWISAMEAAGEAVLKKKSGAVQNSPPDKVLPEPGPWSPVKRKSQDLGPFDCTKYTIPLSNSTGGNSCHESSC